MKKVQVWSWLISGFLRKHKKIILLGISLGISLSIFFIWVLPYIPRPTPKVRVGLIGQYTRNDLPPYIMNKVGQGLTFILKDGKPVPALAERWTASPDSMTYTFFLRDNLYWQDGTKVTAKDIIYAFTDVEVKTPDDKTIQFNLKDSFTPFPNLLNRPVLKKGMVGTGEYKIKRIKEKNNYVESVILESPKEIIEIKFFPNLNFASTAFTLGEIDEIYDAYKNPFDTNKEWSSVTSVKSIQNNNQYVALFLNNADPNLQDKTFRQALAYATPKPSDGSRALGPISKDSWAYNAEVKPYDFDPKRAKELLEKSIGSLDKANTITLNIATTQQLLDQADLVKQSWEENLGIKVNVSIVNSITPDFEILLASEEMPSDPDQYSLWHSTQSQNFIKFNNKRIDKILEDARKEQNEEKRLELYNDFQRFFVEESPVIFLYYPNNYTITRNNWVKTTFRKLIQFGKLKQET